MKFFKLKLLKIIKICVIFFKKLMVEMSSYTDDSYSNLHKCLEYLLINYFNTDCDDENKSFQIVQRIIKITATNDLYIEDVIKLCLAGLEKTNDTNANKKYDFTFKNININTVIKKDILCIRLITSFSKYENHYINKNNYNYNNSNFNNNEISKELLVKDYTLFNIFIKNWKEFNSKTIKDLNDNNIDNNNIDLSYVPSFSHFSIQANIKERLKLYEELINNNSLWDNEKISYIEFLYNILLKDAITKMDSNYFYDFIKNNILAAANISRNEHNSENKDILNEIYNLFKNNILKDNKLACQNLNMTAFEIYLSLFIDKNIDENKLKIVKSNSNISNNMNYNYENNGINYYNANDRYGNVSNYSVKNYQTQAEAAAIAESNNADNDKSSALIDLSKEHYYIICPPEELTGFDILWKIVFESFSEEIMNKGIEILHGLYNNISDNDNNNNNNDGFSLLSDKDNTVAFAKKPSEQLLQKCLNLIIEVYSNNSNNNLQEKSNIIVKCLRFLELIIEESEKTGTANIKSHSALLKKSIIEVKIISFINTKSINKLKLYSNTTIWELIQIISNKINISGDFIEVSIKNTIANTDNNNKKINNNNNTINKRKFNLNKQQSSQNTRVLDSADYGKTIDQLKINFGDEIIVNKNKLLDNISKVSLVDKSKKKLNPQLIKVLNIIFDKFTTDDKMHKEDCCCFIKEAIKEDVVPVNDSRVTSLFEAHDKNNLGYITREEFINFYYLCIIHNDKTDVVWKNLNNLGIRNDLKTINEDYHEYISKDKTKLPRYALAHNEEFFNILFKLQDFNNNINNINNNNNSITSKTDNIAKKAFNFISLICTNPVIYNKLKNNANLNWDQIISFNLDNNHSNNIYKIIYSLQIIESFLEDIDTEINNETVDNTCLVTTNDNNDNDNNNTNSLNNQLSKETWIKNFLNNKGYEVLINNFSLLISCINKNKTDLSYVYRLFFELSIKIIKTLFFYVNLNDKNSKLIEASIKDKLNYNYDLLSKEIITLLDRLFNECDSNYSNTLKSAYLIENSFEFLLYILCIYSNNLDDNIILNQVSTLIFKGLYCNIKSIRINFNESIVKLSKCVEVNSKINNYFLTIFNNHYLHIIENYDNNNIYYNNFFDAFNSIMQISLLKIKDNNNNKNKNLAINHINLFTFIINRLKKEIGNNNNIKSISNNSTPNNILSGEVQLLATGLENINSSNKLNILNNYPELFDDLLLNILFKNLSTEELQEKFNNCVFINKDKLNDSSILRSKNVDLKNACYSLILSILKDSYNKYNEFLDMLKRLNENNNNKNNNKRTSNNNINNAISKRWNNTSFNEKRENHVGIKNLGCICYMNSMLQQFFMVQTFRYNILNVDDNISPELNRNNQHNVDDNFLHQVQRMFSYLDLSDRDDYNPSGFCFSFKDWDGNPINVSIQQDSQEFLNKFLDTLEEQIKHSHNKYMINSVFGGKTCSEIICEEGCGNVKYRFELFNNLNLEVRNQSTLDKSLEKFIIPEKIDNYFCETCQKKVTITKRNSLSELPNVLIIYLPRITYNYEIERNEKINSRLEFPRELNLKKYTIEELSKNNNSNKNNNNDNNNNNNKNNNDNNTIEEDLNKDVFYKSNEYYEYDLAGVNVHIGSADAGHYFSYINTVRGGLNNVSEYNRDNIQHRDSWLKFNDSFISKFNINNLEDECFGGINQSNNNSNYYIKTHENIQSAYMLIYERKFKNPLKTVIPNFEESITSKESIISYKEELSKIIYNKSNILRYSPDSDNYKKAEFIMQSSIFHDLERNEYYTYKPFFTKDKVIPKEYFLEIMQDNLNFQKHKTIYDSYYQKFYNNIFEVIYNTYKNLVQEVINTSANNNDKAIELSDNLMNCLINYLSVDDKKQIMSKFIDMIISLNQVNDQVSIVIIKNLFDKRSFTSSYFINQDDYIVSNYCKLVYAAVKTAYKHSKDKILEANSKQKYGENYCDYCVKMLDYILVLFPKVPRTYTPGMYPIYSLLNNIALFSDEMIHYFFKKNTINIFITYLLGKESPFFPDYQPNNNNQSSDYNFMQDVVNPEAAIEFIIFLLKRSTFFYNNEYVKNYNLNSNSNIPCYELSNKCIISIKHFSFLKILLNHNENAFSELITMISYKNEEFTLNICNMLIKLIETFNYSDIKDIVKVIRSIQLFLNINDNYQQIRLEYLLGYPQMIVNEPNNKYKLPILGYRKISNTKSKWLEVRSVTNSQQDSTNIIKKLFSYSSNESFVVEVMSILFERCIDNKFLYFYLNKYLIEEPIYGKK